MSPSVSASAAAQPPAPSAFTLRAVSKTFGDRKALDDIDLTITKGELVALIGPSGSGKSTLLRTLNGLVRIDPGAGRVEAFGLALQENGRVVDRRRSVRARIGLVAQQFNLVGRLSLFSNVMIGALARLPVWRGALALWPSEDRRRAMEALNRVGVGDFAGQRANTLSGGQQQRGAIARVLVQAAEAVLADEPIASLDPVASQRVMELLQQLNRTDGLTILVTLHNVDQAMRYCPRIVALKAGRITYDGPAGGLTRAMLADLYGAEIEGMAADAPSERAG